MIFIDTADLLDSDFKRLTGIKRETFNKMVEILVLSEYLKRKRGGRKPCKSVEDRLLMALEYWREYRTYYHIALNNGLSESQCFRNIRSIENILIKDGTFSLPGKKELWKSENELEIVLIDATESVIERPKKNSKSTILAKRKSIL